MRITQVNLQNIRNKKDTENNVIKLSAKSIK